MCLKQQAASHINLTERDLLSLHKKKVSLKKEVKFGANVIKWGGGSGHPPILEMFQFPFGNFEDIWGGGGVAHAFENV